LGLFVAAALGVAGCSSIGSSPPAAVHATAPLFDNLGSHHRRITTSSGEAQRYFDQGLTWTYGFNHDEALRSFRQAAALDPGCAMAYYGIALASGPHINNPGVPEDRAREAGDAIPKAQALARNATRTEPEPIP